MSESASGDPPRPSVTFAVDDVAVATEPLTTGPSHAILEARIGTPVLHANPGLRDPVRSAANGLTIAFAPGPAPTVIADSFLEFLTRCLAEGPYWLRKP